MGANEGLWGPHGAPWGAVGAPWGPMGGCVGCVGHTAPRVTRFCADFCYIMSIFAFSADFHDFLATKLATPILAERRGRANPWDTHETADTQSIICCVFQKKAQK